MNKIGQEKSFSSWKRRVMSKGFTIVEALIAFAILVIVMSGVTMAITSSLRLNRHNQERATSQDIVRDVISKYVKNADYDQIYPFDTANGGVNPASYYGSGNAPYSIVIYNASNSTLINNLSTYGLSRLQDDLTKMNKPILEMLVSPIK